MLRYYFYCSLHALLANLFDMVGGWKPPPVFNTDKKAIIRDCLFLLNLIEVICQGGWCFAIVTSKITEQFFYCTGIFGYFFEAGI